MFNRHFHNQRDNPFVPPEAQHFNRELKDTDVDPGLVNLGGTGRWQNWMNTKTGEQSIKHHALRVVQEWCKEADHYFEVLNPKKRIGTCKHCKMERPFVLGKNYIKDGQFKTNSQKR